MTFEYKILQRGDKKVSDFEKEMNKTGEEGWEGFTGGFDKLGQPTYVIFKKEKPTIGE